MATAAIDSFDDMDINRNAERLVQERLARRSRGPALQRPAAAQSSPLSFQDAPAFDRATRLRDLGAIDEGLPGSARAAGPVPNASAAPAAGRANPWAGKFDKTFSPGTRKAFNTAGRATMKGAKAVGKAARATGGLVARATPAVTTVGIEALNALPTLQDPNASGLDKAAVVAEGVGRGASTLAGAGIGASIGSVVPLVGTAIGGIVGAGLGYLGGDKLIKWGRNRTGAHPYRTPSVLANVNPGGVTEVPTEIRPQGTTGQMQREAWDLMTKEPGIAEGIPVPSGSGIYKQGSTYTDQPIADGLQFIPARGGFVASTNPDPLASQRRALNNALYAAQSDGERAARYAENDIANIDSINVARQQRGRQDLKNAVTDARADASSSSGFTPRQRAAMLQQAQQLQAQGAANQAAPVAIGAPRTPEQTEAISRSRQAGALAASTGGAQLAQEEAQAIDAGLQAHQKQQQAHIMEQLGKVGADSPERRSLERTALVMQGKDPRAETLKSARTPVGIDSMGNPVMGDYLYDGENQQWLMPPGAAAVGQQGGQKPSLEEFKTKAKADPRYNGVSDEMIEAKWRSLGYGN